MGGGDLNLKKSWHPSTLRNIERVWKAEQKHEVEQQKIEQLQKELAAERARNEMRSYAEDQGVVKKRDERLDWMYQGPAAMVNREDYLLGRKIDKTFEILQMQEKGGSASKEESNEPTSLFHPNASVPDVTVDLATKIREDPLFAIMKKEKEQRKNLLTNPVKMKQLQAMLKDTLKKDKKKKSKKSKKSKRKYKSDSSSSSHSDSEAEVNGESSHAKRNSRYSEKERRQDRNDYRSERNGEMRYYQKNNRHDKQDYESRRTKYRSEYEGKRKNRDGDDDYNVVQKIKKETIIDEKPRERERSNTYERKHCQDSRSSYQKPRTEKKMSAEDKERLRQEMMENAKWREKQRTKNVKRYVKEGEKEDKIGEGSASNFIQPMLSKAAEKGTVENRVRQKIFTIQRNKSDMDRNFARR